MPNLYIIAGCNGAGKTTASMTVLPEILNCYEFVNADEIARGLSPFRPEKVAIEAGRIMLNRLNQLIESGVDFAFETTLSTKSYVSYIKKAKENGYKVTLIFIFLKSDTLAKLRVKARVLRGGHNIEESVVERRYKAGLNNFFQLYMPVCDFWLLVDNSSENFELNEIASGESKNTKLVLDNNLWNQINHNYGNIEERKY
jgi:predicted ABC-type ATPase